MEALRVVTAQQPELVGDLLALHSLGHDLQPQGVPELVVERTIIASLLSIAMSITKALSIFSVLTGRRLR